MYEKNSVTIYRHSIALIYKHETDLIATIRDYKQRSHCKWVEHVVAAVEWQSWVNLSQVLFTNTNFKWILDSTYWISNMNIPWTDQIVKEN